MIQGGDFTRGDGTGGNLRSSGQQGLLVQPPSWEGWAVLGRRGLLEAGLAPSWGPAAAFFVQGPQDKGEENGEGVVWLSPHQQACRSGPSALVTFLEAPRWG